MKVALIAPRLRRRTGADSARRFSRIHPATLREARPGALRATLRLHWRKERATVRHPFPSAIGRLLRERIPTSLHFHMLQVPEQRSRHLMRPAPSLPVHKARDGRALFMRSGAPSAPDGAASGAPSRLRLQHALVMPTSARAAGTSAKAVQRVSQRLHLTDATSLPTWRPVLRRAHLRGLLQLAPIQLPSSAAKPAIKRRYPSAGAMVHAPIGARAHFGGRGNPSSEPPPDLRPAPLPIRLGRAGVVHSGPDAMPWWPVRQNLTHTALPAAQAAPVGTGTGIRTASMAPTRLQPTLVWRPSLPPSNAAAAPPLVQPGARDGATPPIIPAAISQSVVAEARAAARQEMQSAPNLDRLATDLMARIDKRLRIERERRGR